MSQTTVHRLRVVSVQAIHGCLDQSRRWRAAVSTAITPQSAPVSGSERADSMVKVRAGIANALVVLLHQEPSRNPSTSQAPFRIIKELNMDPVTFSLGLFS